MRPTRFQEDTIRRALDALTRPAAEGCRRFLVADEVGLGKTVVAAEIVRRMAEASRGRPLRVFYICSNKDIANQNAERLVKFRTETGVHPSSIIALQDRLTLLPCLSASERPRDSVVHLYALTPLTSLPGVGNRLYAGKKDERQVLYHFLNRHLGKDLRYATFNAMRSARHSAAFYLSGNRTYGADAGDETRIQKSLEDARNWARRAESRFHEIPTVAGRIFRKYFHREFGSSLSDLTDLTAKPAPYIGRLRRVLAATIIERQPPDLIILDEFQRFLPLIGLTADGHTEEKPDYLRELLFSHSGAAVLMLSATPYKLHVRRWEELETRGHQPFSELVNFLYAGNPNKADQLQRTLSAFRKSLEDLGRSAPHSEARSQCLAACESARVAYESVLRPVISRNQRPVPSGGQASDQDQTIVSAPARNDDIRTFIDLTGYLGPKKQWALPFWMSVPLPVNMLGPGYKVWRERPKRTAHQYGQALRSALSAGSVDKIPSTKLRLLAERVDIAALAMPWQAPCMPWWRLEGKWANGSPGKTLLFSKFRATPVAISGVVSHLAAASVGVDLRKPAEGRVRLWEKATKFRWCLFHPARLLGELCDPVAVLCDLHEGSTFNDVRKLLIKRARTELESRGVRFVRRAVKTNHLPKLVWQIELLGEAGDLASEMEASWKGAISKAGVSTEKHLPDFRTWFESALQQGNISITQADLVKLVDHALTAPGCVLYRVLKRALGKEPDLSEVVYLSWSCFRIYMENRVFMAYLRRRNASSETLVRGAVRDGNLEAVLDEHVWMTRNDEETPVQVLEGVFNLNPGKTPTYAFKRGSIKGPSMITNAAMSFLGATHSKDDETGRSGNIRRAFNSPFWPHLLATTSVGQEGLDFHHWCALLVHWDLCSNPIDLEQREGRITRYAGYAVRKRLAELYREQQGVDYSPAPWHDLGKWAEERFSSAEADQDSGLSPWWSVPGAEINALALIPSHSEQVSTHNGLRLRRLLYRIILGQTNQDDLIAKLKIAELREDQLKNLAPNLGFCAKRAWPNTESVR